MTIPEDERKPGEEGGSEPASEAQAAPHRGNSGLPITMIVIAAALMVACAAYTAYWMVAVAQLEARVAGWIEDRRAEGLRVEHGSINRSGFPRRLRVTIAPFEIAAPAGWAWRAPEIKVRADPFAPRSLRFSVSGMQEVRLPFNQGSFVFAAGAERLDADVTAGGGMLIGRGIGEQVTLRSAGAGEAESLRIGRLELVSTPGPAATASTGIAGYRFSLVASDLVLPAAAGTPLGDRIEALSMLTEVTGDSPGEVSGMTWPKALARWRDDGGTVEVRGLALAYGPLKVTGDGTLALDATGEPIGAFSLRATGLLEALRVLAESGMISPTIAAGAAFVFRPPQGSGEASFSVPASLQDRKLYLGPLPIARIPSPPWVPLPGSGS